MRDLGVPAPNWPDPIDLDRHECWQCRTARHNECQGCMCRRCGGHNNRRI